MASPTDILIESGTPLPEEPVILSVTLPYGHMGGYYINGEQKPVLTLVIGGTYIFDQSDISNTGHPLGLSSVFESGSLEGLTFYINGSEYSQAAYEYYLQNYASSFSSFEIHYTVPENASETLYYFCHVHTGLGSTVTVSSPGAGGSQTISENEAGAILGNLVTVDEDTGDTFTYTLSGRDAEKFEIVEGQLK